MRVAVFAIDAIGYLKPILAAVAPLASDARFDAVMGFGRPFMDGAFARAGLNFATTMSDPQAGDHDKDLRWKSFVRPMRDIERTMDAVRRFAPDVILYDSFSVYGPIAAAVTGKPYAAFVPMHGYGALSDAFVRANAWDRDDVLDANASYRRRFGVDLKAAGALPTLFPSQYRNLVNTSPYFFNPVDPQRQPLLHALLRNCAPETPIGLFVDWEALAPESEFAADRSGDDALLDDLRQAKADGAKVVLFSLGTVITDFRYASPVGGAPSGFAFLQRMLRFATEAARRHPDLVIVASVGRRYFTEEDVSGPPNVLPRARVPQVKILRSYADAFVTHHGMNSQAEAVLSGVGMISLPGAGDQISNAEAAIANGVAVALWDIHDPFSTCSAATLAEAIRRVVAAPTYRAACNRVAKQMAQPHNLASLQDHLLGLGRSAPARSTHRGLS
jgi:UDP:flavonoid glycosyltransferase YjiC (YdhE family)